MKVCKTCENIKEFELFSKSKRHKDGYMSECKECISIKRSEYYYSRHDYFRNQNKEYYEQNKEIIYQNIDKEKKKEIDIRYAEKHKDKIKIKKQEYYHKNREEILEKRKKYYEENKDVLNKTSDSKREIKKRSYQKRKHQFLWRRILKRTIDQLKIGKKSSTENLLGYDHNELKTHLEKRFLENMSWENYGEWHVDHIIPISKFKKDTPPNIVNRLDNLRPLWAIDNIKRQNQLNQIEEIYKYLIDEFSEWIVDIDEVRKCINEMNKDDDNYRY
jgi:hypothetical protein